jgi:hypothetical protein
MAGWFTFVGPRDLLAKLERERRAIQLDPLDADMALNLCMTGFHLYWLLPGDANKTAWSALIDAEPLLQILEHVANGAKHFHVDRHDAVLNAGGAPHRSEVPFGLGPGARIVNTRMLYIQLDGAPRAAFG